MAEPLIPVQTIKYKQYVKETLVEALRPVFASHPDALLAATKIDVDFPLTEAGYPAIVVRFYERSIKNAGVGHVERVPLFNPTTGAATGFWVKYKHYLYNGDIEFAVYALSSLDRDLVSDSLVQTLTMGELEPYANQLLQRVYYPNPTAEPTSVGHFVNLNTDEVEGFGETQQLAPWGAEDVMVYQTSYRVGIMGEFYSRTPTTTGYPKVKKVESFPYSPISGGTVPNPPWAGPDGIQGTQDDVVDPAPWQG